ncbi:MAG: exo-alpha-sialidase [Nitrospinae bacterium]|nr:exo-alpha-sialidase [Nitrospinota bacterium]
MKSQKSKIKSQRLLVYSFIILWVIVSYTFSIAGDISFGSQLSINHPDKRVSNASAIIDDDGRIYIGWVKEDGNKNNIYVASSTDNGKTFSEKVRVNGDADMPSGINHAPTMALGIKGELYIAWTISRIDGEFSSDIKFSRSLDKGNSFEPAIVINDDNLPVSHGFESMTVAPDGSIYIAWLDGREKKEGVSSTYIAKSTDNGKTFEKNVRVDGNSCPCCKTAVTVAHNGTVYVSWRKVFKGDNREIVLAKSTDKGKSFSESVVVGNDKWVIAGCPHRGPSISSDKNGVLYVVWYTEGETGSPSIYIANSKDKGMSFSKKVIPFSNGTFPDHPVMTLDRDGKPLIAWEETTPVLSRLIFQQMDEKTQQMNQGVKRAHDPVLSINKIGDILITWSQEEIRFTRTAFRLFRGE